MKKTTHQLGSKGERIAAAYLRQKGYKILNFNWRYSTLEIDLIAQFQSVIIFIEVKYRSHLRYGEIDQFISEEKIHNLTIAAGHYLDQHSLQSSCRFDVITIRPHSGYQFKIRHFEDAFFPDWT